MSDFAFQLDPLDSLATSVREAGAELTDDAARILAGWQAKPRDPVALYARGVIENDAALREQAASLAASTGMDAGQLRKRAQAIVKDRLVAEVKKVSVSAYERAAEDFDAAWAALVESHRIVPVGVTTMQLADPNTPNKARIEAPQQYAKVKAVDDANKRLTAAAKLVGIMGNADTVGASEAARIALVVDTSAMDARRPLFDAWRDQSHRLGRWGALVEAGIPVRAAALNPTSPKAYRWIEPERPVETVQVKTRVEVETGRAAVGIQQIEWDPESGTPRPE